jgi:hypothetical protein
MYCQTTYGPDGKTMCLPAYQGGGTSLVYDGASMDIKPVTAALAPQGFTILATEAPGTDDKSIERIATAMGVFPKYAEGGWTNYDQVLGSVNELITFDQGDKTRTATGVRPDGVYVQMSWNPHSVEGKDGNTYFAMHVGVRTPYRGQNQFALAKSIAKAWMDGRSIYPLCSVDPDYASAKTRPENPNRHNNMFVAATQPGVQGSSVVPGQNMAWYSYLYQGKSDKVPALGACFCTDANCNDLPIHCTEYEGPSSSGPGHCTACEPRYGIDSGMCVACSSNCSACKEAKYGTTCVDCDPGYYLITDSTSYKVGTCATCPTSCLTCETVDNTPSCLTCAPGNYLVTDRTSKIGKCVACPHPCLTCEVPDNRRHHHHSYPTCVTCPPGTSLYPTSKNGTTYNTCK